MEVYSREFALFIDGIRSEKDLSRIDFIDGIISLSQYKRYLKGNASIPNNVVIELANRLKYNITDLYSIYTRKYNKEDKQLREIYSLIKLYKYEEAHKSLTKLNIDLLVSTFYKSLYEYLVIHVQHILGRVSDVHVLSLYSELINYPSVMKNESFNMVELSVLQQIVVVSSNMDNYEPANLLYKILTSGSFSYSSSNDTSILAPVYYAVARVFYRQSQYIETLQLVDNGIKVAQENENSNALPHLFLLGALVLKHQSELEKSYIYIKKCFMQIFILESKSMFETFKETYASNFDKPLDELLGNFSDMMK